jgi:UDP-N-acetylglucosamine 2-epimerase (non-hydrolysing)/GDP/UDP-N,N'-diacetylbacillosamine 2-epimerase (hydrolysing)
VAKRIIAVFTGNRAEYGLQYPILKAIREHPDLDYRLIVSGAHLEENCGRTIQEIRDDGFEVAAEVKIDLTEDTLYATAQAIGSGIISISQALAENKPHFLIVYGDRYEAFSAVVAATQMNIPTVHIEGGDLTEGGALDDSVRHAISKLAHLHFTTNRLSTKRLLAMGEEDWRIQTVGLPALDDVREGNYASPAEVQERLSIDLDLPIIIFTQHSITTQLDQVEEQIQPSLAALERLVGEETQIIITYPNNDAGGRRIVELLQVFVKAMPSRVQIYQSLGRHLYRGTLGLARKPGCRITCVGNSSSGIKETAVFGCPSVNIGNRQSGRLRGDNVIDVDYDAPAIYSAIRKCLFDDDFRDRCKSGYNAYGDGYAGGLIAERLASLPLDRKKLITKQWVWYGPKTESIERELQIAD